MGKVSDPNSDPPRVSPTGLRSLAGLRVLVVGLGRFGGGVGVTRWLAQQGANVTVTDQAGCEALAESVTAVADLGVTLHLGRHDPRDLDSADLVIVNPAVDKARATLFHEIVQRKIPWTTELNLFCERCPGRVIGVTGTYGKSTTCAMLAAVLAACQRTGDAGYTGVNLGGNIGRSLLPELDAIRPTDLVVLEMSNAQLEDLPRISWAPEVVAVVNVSPHHLDRYSAYVEYVAAKLNIIGPPEVTKLIVLGEFDSGAERLLHESVGSTSDRLVRVNRPDPPLELRVPGDHNQANAACVLAVCHYLRLDEMVVLDALKSFAGLPHRLEHVGRFDGVDYYNDSKSTSPLATITAVNAMKQPIVAIVGGQDKHVPLSDCAAALVGACRRIICMGEAGPAFAQAIRAAEGATDATMIREVSSLTDAVRMARAEARPGDTVLFSPGTPSFDAFANFVERGRRFIEAVRDLNHA